MEPACPGCRPGGLVSVLIRAWSRRHQLSRGLSRSPAGSRKVHMPLFRQRQTPPASNNVLIYRFVQLYPPKMRG
jgi:hypothetical protein